MCHAEEEGFSTLLFFYFIFSCFFAGIYSGDSFQRRLSSSFLFFPFLSVSSLFFSSFLLRLLLLTYFFSYLDVGLRDIYHQQMITISPKSKT